MSHAQRKGKGGQHSGGGVGRGRVREGPRVSFKERGVGSREGVV